MIEQKSRKINSKFLKFVNKDTNSPQTNNNDTQLASVTPSDQTSEPVLKNITNDTVVPVPKVKSLEEQAIEEMEREARGEKLVEVAGEIDLPLLIKYRNPEIDSIANEEERYRADVESRPEESSLDDYERTPITEFGKGLLRGMGWSEGGNIGLTNAKHVKPIEFVKRPGYRTGLGATPLEMAAPPSSSKKRIPKQGESQEDKEPKVLMPGPDGRTRHIRDIDEELVPISKTGIRSGSYVSVIAGRHNGMFARVKTVLDSGEVTIRLLPGEEEVRVQKTDLVLSDEKTATQKKSSEKRRESSSSSSSSSSSRSSSSSSNNSGKREESWLHEGLVVRIVSKSLADGRYYLKKGKITLVKSPLECTVQLLEDSRKLVDVKQRNLETVIPSAGERVMVVSGSRKGKIGTLMSKQKRSDETFGMVQLLEDLSIKEYSLDSISFYQDPRE